MKNDPTKKVELRDILPAYWFSDNDEVTVWISCYRILRLTKDDFSPEVNYLFDVGDVRVAILFGSFTYMDYSHVESQIETPDSESTVMRVMGNVSEAETPFAAYSYFFTRFDTDNPTSEGDAARNIDVAVGFLASFNGRNIVYEHYYDNLVNIIEHQTSVFGKSQENPLWFPIPELNKSKIDLIRQANELLKHRNENDRNRTNLALQWFSKGIFSKGTDAFLAFWIALETLSMPDGTNIRPLVECLSRAYEITYEDARDRFKVGRLFGFRSQLVHSGLMSPIHGNLLSYIEGLFVDILFESLGLETEKRAESIQNKPDFDLQSYLA